MSKLNYKNVNKDIEYKFISEVGVELEGGFDAIRDMLKHDNIHISDDPSVHTVSMYKGEIINKSDNLEKLCDWIEKYYPSEVNKSCGFHIHISFKNREDFDKLATPEFYEYFLMHIGRWGIENYIPEDEFWDRYFGKNTYCKRVFMAHNQRSGGKCQTKYTHLNYAIWMHGTLENRLFPMFQNKNLSIHALCFYVALVEKYLAKINKLKIEQTEIIAN